jgi:Ca2+-binding EF-hand superfamily protein
MPKFSLVVLTIAVSWSLAAPLALVATTTSAGAISPLSTYDTNKDGTLDLDEVKAAAAAAFDRLDKDKNGTIGRKETGLHMSGRELKEADTNNDGKLSKDEYVAWAEKLFNDADKNHDGKLTARELRTVPGHALLRLIK